MEAFSNIYKVCVINDGSAKTHVFEPLFILVPDLWKLPMAMLTMMLDKDSLLSEILSQMGPAEPWMLALPMATLLPLPLLYGGYRSLYNYAG